MIQIQNLEHGFAGKILYENCNFTFDPGKKYALVGANGTGKTTLFKLMMADESPLRGKIVKPQKIRMEFLAQELDYENDLSILESVLSSFSDLFAKEKKLIQLHALMEDKNADLNLLSKEIESLQYELNQSQFYALEATAKKILAGLGFDSLEFSKNLSQFSGGWQMRAHLARMLLKEPDFLLLDEPTNHLDIDSLIWLENYLKSYEKSLIIISHDRRFLDKIIDHCVVLENRQLILYKGNFTDYETQHSSYLLQEEKNLAKKQEEIDHIQQFVERFRYKATKARQVQSRLKMLEKMSINSVPNKRERLRFTFDSLSQSGKIVFELKQLTKSFNKKIFDSINAVIYRGDKIALLGPNGAGKSTLIKILSGLIQADNGTVKIGSNVKLAVFSQHQIDQLNFQSTIYDEILTAAVESKRLLVRNICGAFLFHGEDVFKKINVLSGGEKARVAMAKILVSEANTLILDEPTNHLDLHAKEHLQNVLIDFEGTIIIISHDRDFLDGLVQRIFYLNQGQLAIFEGDLDYFEEKRTVFKSKKEEDSSIKHLDYLEQKKQKNILSKLKKESEIIESELDAIDLQIKEIQQLLTTDLQKYSEHLNRLNELEEKSRVLMEKWMKINEEILALES